MSWAMPCFLCNERTPGMRRRACVENGAADANLLVLSGKGVGAQASTGQPRYSARWRFRSGRAFPNRWRPAISAAIIGDCPDAVFSLTGAAAARNHTRQNDNCCGNAVLQDSAVGRITGFVRRELVEQRRHM